MELFDYKIQEALFEEQPSRLTLQRLSSNRNSAPIVSVNVWRNHTIEPVLSLANAYQHYGQYSVDYRLSDYDDSLTFSGHQTADLELLWLNNDRYASSAESTEWIEWLNSRVHSLRCLSSAPIVVATWLKDDRFTANLQTALEANVGVFFANIKRVCDIVGIAAFDLRVETSSGTPLSNRAQITLARELACHWIPAAIFPPIKVVALDLDNTLHAGVLGEDGVEGVRLTHGHRELQLFLKTLQQRGVFISLVSRNERIDVEALFSKRKDYPLQWEDFSTVEISWGDKAAALNRIARSLRVSLDSILFIDDNPGELISVLTQLPMVHTILANIDASNTKRAIEYYPRLWRWRIESDDTKRIQDMRANAERQELLQTTNIEDYFRNLQVNLVFRVNPVDQLGRLADLCKKTNQFNLAVQRFSEADLSEKMCHSSSCVISIQMLDRLSDSGVIGLVVAERHDDHLMVEELCISCRALGRRLENTMIIEALRSAPQIEGCVDIGFRVRAAQRNAPALAWFAQFFGHEAMPSTGAYISSFLQQITEFVPPSGVLLTRK